MKAINKNYKNKDREYERVNAAKGRVYTIHTNKYTEHIPRKPTTKSIRDKGIDKYANAQTTECTHTTMLQQYWSSLG